MLQWARGDDRVDAVVLTGSRARRHGDDEWSDVDIEIIGPGWRQLAADHGWYETFADVMVRLTFDTGQPWPTRLVVYTGGRQVDFTVAATRRLHDMTTQGLDVVYRRGYRVLLDRAWRPPSPASTPTMAGGRCRPPSTYSTGCSGPSPSA